MRGFHTNSDGDYDEFCKVEGSPLLASAILPVWLRPPDCALWLRPTDPTCVAM